MSGVATKFWIVCREETPLTQQLIKTINDWRLPGVRARLSYQMPLSSEAAIAQASHTIFITLGDHSGNQIKITPISGALSTMVQSPVSFLNTVRHRHEIAPNAWCFQVSTTEKGRQGIKPIPTEHTLSQTLTKVEVFVRNYVSQYQRTCQLTLTNREKAVFQSA